MSRTARDSVEIMGTIGRETDAAIQFTMEETARHRWRS